MNLETLLFFGMGPYVEIVCVFQCLQKSKKFYSVFANKIDNDFIRLNHE